MAVYPASADMRTLAGIEPRLDTTQALKRALRDMLAVLGKIKGEPAS